MSNNFDDIFNESNAVVVGVVNRTTEYTQPITVSSGIVNGSCVFYGIGINPDGINNITLNVYDNTTAAGNQLLPSDVVINGTSGLTSITFDKGLYCENGIYINVICSGTLEYQVYYNN